MTPDTIHMLAQVIRHERAFWTVFQTWAQKQPPSETRDELFRIIDHKRRAIKFEEHLLSNSEVSPVIRANASSR